MRISYKALGANGRLGNQLFQIGGTIGRAQRSGDIDNAVFPHWAYQPYFEIPDHYFVAPHDIADTIDIGRAYLQDFHEFDGCIDEIRRFFAPSPMAIDEAQSIHSHLGKYAHTTAVHVRRGDYLNHLKTFAVCPIHYFTIAMDHMRSKRPGNHFLIFSDDIQWCRENFTDLDDVTIMTHSADTTSLQAEMADFNVMRTCDSFIISNSTFSWWAAFLSKSDDVICPATWLIGDSVSEISLDRFLPSNWQRNSIGPIGPMRTPFLLVSEGDDGYILTDSRTQQIHHLNPTATLLYELCTGSNTRDEIKNMMTMIVPDDSWIDGLSSLITLGVVTDFP